MATGGKWTQFNELYSKIAKIMKIIDVFREKRIFFKMHFFLLKSQLPILYNLYTSRYRRVHSILHSFNSSEII